MVKDMAPAARAIGRQVQVLKADTSQAIDAAFARLRASGPTRFSSTPTPSSPPGASLVQLTAYHGVPAIYLSRVNILKSAG